MDKIPPVELALKFIDLTGPGTIPATSAETVIKIAATAPPRPAKQVEVTQALDTRQFAISGALALEIKAVGNGLVPDLDGALDLAAVALLRRLRTSQLVQLGAARQQELQQDLQRVRQTCFGGSGSKMSEADLRSLAEQWLRAAC